LRGPTGASEELSKAIARAACGTWRYNHDGDDMTAMSENRQAARP
jgi:hypothetical protein